MKLIFLDFDGVLNNRDWLSRRSNGAPLRDHEMIDPKAVAILNRIISETGADVVISSTWRILSTLGELREFLEQAGFRGNILGVTPRDYDTGYRGNEIQKWINDNVLDTNVLRITILDDDSDMEHLTKFLVNTDFEVGLTDADADVAIEMLNKKDEIPWLKIS